MAAKTPDFRQSTAAMFLSMKDSLATDKGETTGERVRNIPISEISDFPDHPFKVRQDEAMVNMVESIYDGLDLMMALFRIVQGIISRTMDVANIGSIAVTSLPDGMTEAIQDLTFFQSIPAWAVSLIGSLVIIVLSFVMIMSVYGRFFKLYLYTAIAPIPLCTISDGFQTSWQMHAFELCTKLESAIFDFCHTFRDIDGLYISRT